MKRMARKIAKIKHFNYTDLGESSNTVCYYDILHDPFNSKAFRICNGQRLTRFKHANLQFGEYILESYALLQLPHLDLSKEHKPINGSV